MKQKTCCVLCDYGAEFESIHPLDKNFRYDCPNCGTFYVDQAFKECDKSEIPLSLLSGFAWEQTKYGGMTKIAITFNSYKNILNTYDMPKTREERLEQLMLYYYKKIGNDLKHSVSVNRYPARCYALNVEELAELFFEAVDKEYLALVSNANVTSRELNANDFVQVTYEGAVFCETIKEKKRKEEHSTGVFIWPMIHPEITRVAKKLIVDGHYDSAITISTKLLVNRVKDIYYEKTGDIMDGTPLMQKVFNPKNPVLLFEDIKTTSGYDLQDGYRNIFVGMQLGIRNPYSHDSARCPSEYETLHIIGMLSHLMYMIDKALEYTNSIE